MRHTCSDDRIQTQRSPAEPLMPLRLAKRLLGCSVLAVRGTADLAENVADKYRGTFPQTGKGRRGLSLACFFGSRH